MDLLIFCAALYVENPNAHSRHLLSQRLRKFSEQHH